MWRFKRWHCHRQSSQLRQQNRQLNRKAKTRAQSGSQDCILILYPSVQPGKKLISVHRLNFGRFRGGRSRSKIGTAFDRPPPPQCPKSTVHPFVFDSFCVSVYLLTTTLLCETKFKQHPWINPREFGGPLTNSPTGRRKVLLLEPC